MIGDNILNSDFGVIIIENLFLNDIKTLERLYSMFPLFRDMLNSKKVLEYFRYTYRIISPISDFPELCCQYCIKYIDSDYDAPILENGWSNPFSKLLCTNIALKNADIEACNLILSSVVPKDRLYHEIYMLEVALRDKRSECVAYFSNLPQCSNYMSGLNWNLEKLPHLKDDWSYEAGLVNSGRYEEIITNEDVFRSFYNPRCLIKTLMRSLDSKIEYEEVIRLIKLFSAHPLAIGYAGLNLRTYPYMKYLNRLALEGKVKEMQRLIDDGYLEPEHIKKEVFLCYCWLQLDLKKEVWDFVGYDLPQLQDGCLTTLINEPLGNAYDYKANINSSIIVIIKELHKRVENFCVGQRVYDDVCRCKDVLSKHYIEKHNLVRR